MDIEILNYKESKTKSKARENILTISKELFIDRGIYVTTMMDIAKATKISRRSLYYYYNNKEDIAVDIQIVCLNKIMALNLEMDSDDTLCGYELVRALLIKSIKFFLENEDLIKYISRFDNYFNEEYHSDKYTNYLSEKLSIGYTLLRDAFIKGYEDSTIVIDINNIQTIVSTITQSIMAYAQRYIFRKKAFASENTLYNIGDLYIFVDLILKGIENKSVL